jgi:sugar phosphate isomerase/epimerase
MNIAERIGVSTITMTGVSLRSALEAIASAGFKVAEIWAADFQGVIGYPLAPAAGAWPRTCSEESRRDIRDVLSAFDTAIVHVQLYGADVAALNPGIREESRRQYLEALELGIDIGASHVTYHHGSLGDVLGANGPERHRLAWDFNVDMAQTLAEQARGTDILLGYENGLISRTMKLVDAVDRSCFGILLDVPHAAMAAGFKGTEGIIDDLALCRDKIVEVHAHGLWSDVCVLRDHQDLRRSNCLDYGSIMATLRGMGFEGPFVFEVCAPDAAGVIERCREFRDHLVACWEEAP